MDLSHCAGVDEVGRGPLAGDVVAAAVILPTNHGIVGLADSKKLTERRREVLFEEIKQKATAWAVGRASVSEIDEINILQASLLAMRRSVDALDVKPTFIRVDGNKLPKWDYSAEAVVGGDAKHEEISAASIMAKVVRDREMVELDQQYPEYGFAKHKGYPTKVHMAAIAMHGVLLSIDRQSYAPIRRFLAAQ